MKLNRKGSNKNFMPRRSGRRQKPNRLRKQPRLRRDAWQRKKLKQRS